MYQNYKKKNCHNSNRKRSRNNRTKSLFGRSRSTGGQTTLCIRRSLELVRTYKNDQYVFYVPRLLRIR